MQPIDAQIEDAAYRWLARRDRGLTPAEQDAYLDWLRADPRHQAALARVARSWSALDALAEWRPEHSATPNPDLLALPHGATQFPPATADAVRRNVAEVASVRPHSAGRSDAPARFRLFRTAALAAAALGIGLFVASHFRHSPDPGNTSAGRASAPKLIRHEPRRIILPDGSIVALQGDSSVRVSYSATERRVTLDGGEAHFTVAKAPRRPFIVEVKGVAVRAVGTAFNVRVASDAVAVLVTEGQVRLERPRRRVVDAEAAATEQTPSDASPATLAENDSSSAANTGVPPAAASPAPPAPLLLGGQRAVLSLSEPSAPPQIASASNAELEAATEWQALRLTFNDMPLREVAREMNQHNRRQLHIGDTAAGDIRIGGTFRADNVEALIRLLQRGFGVQLQTRGDQTVVYTSAR